MDHGMRYEHFGLYQKLFGTSRESAIWQLKNRGYHEIVKGFDSSSICAVYSEVQQVIVHFRNDFVSRIETWEKSDWATYGDGKLHEMERRIC